MTFSVVGLGSRGMDSYMAFQKTHPQLMKTVAVADPRPERLKKAVEEYGVDESMCFSCADELLSQGVLSDSLIIATQDRDHVPQALKAIEAGYRRILMEKPVSPSKDDCLRLLEAAQAASCEITVCHVLRYTPFYRTLKALIDSGRIGRLVNLDAVEGVGYFHMAHSFVRGNWRREDETSPMLLQKSCHDMDIIRYLVGRPCTAVSSTGSLLWFRPENAPEGAAMRCLDGCAARGRCPFDCEKIYMSDKRSGILTNPHPTWPTEVICDSYSPQAVTDALRCGPYGRCVYHCDNTVVDHQCVMLSFEGGVEATFTMTAFSRENHRTIRIFGTEGEIQGDMLDGRIVLRRFDNDDEVISVSDNGSGHGGGDGQLMLDFISQETTSGLEVSLESHLMCFAAEESRLEGGRRVSLR